MNESQNDLPRYLAISVIDEEWGIVVTTVGHQLILLGCAYPLSRHLEKYNSKPQTGHILNEYQLVYITKGSGYSSSQSCKSQKMNAGTMTLLLPGEWHSYYPDREAGWDEYRVGLRGIRIDKRVEKKFFTKKEPLHRIGLNAMVVELHEDILKFASEGKSGYQQMIPSTVLYILGSIHYKEKNNSFTNAYVVNKTNEVRILMKENIEDPLSLEEIAVRLGLGYSWFRRMSKEYTDVSPAQYQLQQKLLRAKGLLTSTPLTISEIAYSLHFENAGQLPTFFKKEEGVILPEFRDRTY